MPAPDKKKTRVSEAARLEIVSLLRSKSSHVGVWKSIFKGEGFEFAGIRGFEPGDKLKKVHKPSLLREGELRVIEERALRQLKSYVFIDVSRSMDTELKKEIALTAATILAVASLFWGTPVGAMFFGSTMIKKIIPSSDRKQLDNIIEEAVRQFSVKEERTTDIAKSLADLVHIPVRSLIFLISDFIDTQESELGRALASFGRQYDITPLVVEGSGAWNELPPGFYEIDGRDSELGGSELLFLTPSKIKEIREFHEERKKKLASLFTHSGLAHAFLASSDVKTCVGALTDCFNRKIRKGKW